MLLDALAEAAETEGTAPKERPWPVPAPALAEPLMDALSLCSIACCPMLLAPRRAVCVVSPLAQRRHHYPLS
jgi:hypothetical protein